MRIGVVTTSYPRDEDDWAGGFVANRVRTLVGQGHVVQVLAAGAKDGLFVQGGVTVVRVASDLFGRAGAPEALESGDGWSAASTFSARLAAAIAARVDDWDAIESHWLLPCGALAALVARRRPHRAHAHGGDVALLERLRGGRLIARALVRSRATLVFASADLHRRFEHVAQMRIAAAVEPAPIDEVRFASAGLAERAAARARFGITAPVVLAVGRLVAIKGHDLLLAAVAACSPRLRVVIVGAGPEEAALRNAARAADVELTLTGALPPAGVAAWMAAADLLVHPSRRLASGRCEGAPLVVREALGRGLRVVATATGGVRELAGTAGLTLVAEDDPPALGTAIRATLATSACASLCAPTRDDCEVPVTGRPLCSS